MIASLQGQLADKTTDGLIVAVGGVGYEVFFPGGGDERLPGLGGELFLHIQTVVREDSFCLYGFLTAAEKRFFQLLLGVSGVGPRLAINILSGAAPAAIARAVLSEDIIWLKKLPGVGKKSAERLCLELKDKMEFFPVTEAGGAERVGDLSRQAAGADYIDQPSCDALSALLNLGYPPGRAREALEQVRRETGENYAALSLQELLRNALRSLA